MLIRQRLRERGDTIVEVLIAVTVVSMVLGGAYVTTNRSIQTSRNTEEQGNALKMSESQIEQIKGIVSVDPARIFTAAPASFCMYGSQVYNSSSANCKVDRKGAPTTGQPQYALAVSRSGDTFTVNVGWAKLGGNTGNIKMVYRLHE